jgi:GntR family transcriptional regulator/MocR family aminotransferase
VDFKPGVPALDLFPREAWARELAAAVRSMPTAAIGYGEGAGLPALREETAAYLFRSRGIRVAPEEVFITSGISQALGIVSRALLMRGDASRAAAVRGGILRERAILENPCQPALSGLLEREGVEVVPARVDAEGLDPSELPRDASAVAFVTPSHQYPLGPVLPAPRRAALVDWARATGSIVFEDDFDGEYRYGGAPLQPLRELDPERVVYAGSFSKAFAPALRLGYALVPRLLTDAWRACRELMDIHSCVFTQAAMASCLASGAFERHVRRMKRVYSARRAALLGELSSAFGRAEGRSVEVMGEAAGLHLALRFGGDRLRGLRFDEAMVSRIASAGALVYPAARYAFAPLPGIERVLLLGYGNLDEGAIARGVSALAAGLERA